MLAEAAMGRCSGSSRPQVFHVTAVCRLNDELSWQTQRGSSLVCPSAMGTADTLFRLTTAGLGVATILTGAWLGANMYAGFDYHRKHPQAQLGQNLQATSSEAEKA